MKLKRERHSLLACVNGDGTKKLPAGSIAKLKISKPLNDNR